MDTTTQKIIDHSFEYAKDLLEDTGQCYPFGAYVDNAKIVHPLEFEITDKNNIPNNESVIWSLKKYCEKEMAKKNIIAYGITHEASVQLKVDTESIETIAIDIVKTGDEAIPIYYFPYHTDKEDDVVFGETFAVKR